jgi:cell division protein FtsI (penicillin-binding protein 3)
VAIINVKDEVLQRVYMVTLVVIGVALMVYFKAVKLVVYEGDMWRKEGLKKQVVMRNELGERGNILTEDGSLLATSLPYFDIYMDCASSSIDQAQFVQSLDSLSMYMSYYVDNHYTPAEYKEFLWKQRMEVKNRYLPIKKGASFDLTDKIKQFPLFREGKFKGGLIIVRDSKREHPFKMLAQRTLGSIREGANPIGLEGKYNDILSGRAGKKLMQKVGNDVWIPVNDLAEIQPKNGEDVVTTIDINMQDITQQALLRSLEYHQADHGCAIVMEVKTGKIKAVSNIGKSAQGWWETFNYGIAEAIEPGSIFKLASMMALIEEGSVKLSDTVNIENGRTMFYDQEMVDHERTNVTNTTVKKAFAVSSNVGIAKLTNQYFQEKPANYVKHLKNFNLTVPTGVDINGEAVPYVKDPTKKEDQWSGITLPWMAIGYEVKETPLQMLTFYNAVANNGKMMKPYLVSSIQKYGETTQRIEPTVIKARIASAGTIEQAKELLEAVVEYGTASHLKTPQYRFAGKTGTAQLNYERKESNTEVGGYQASFVGYFPAENPVYSCIVVISKPKANGYYGGLVAGPVFREIADKCFGSNIALSEPINSKGKPVLTKNFFPEDVGFKGDLERTMEILGVSYRDNSVTGGDWVFLKAKTDTLQLFSRQMMKKEQVPSVVGMGLKDALYVLENRGMAVRFSGYGKVVSQSLQVGGPAKGQTIHIKLE